MTDTNKKVLALIPARGGSKGLVKKKYQAIKLYPTFSMDD